MSATIEQKIELARVVIRKALREHTPCAVACSFGKDSMAVLSLVLMENPRIDVVWNNTGVEYSETIKFAKKMIEEWNLNIHIAKPEGTNFWKLVEEYGYPSIRRTANKGNPNNIHCCYHLKEKPAKLKYKELGTKLVFTGIRADESRNRMLFAKRCGEYYFAKREGLYKCHPIIDWSEEDVWALHDLLEMPRCEIYDKYPGCRVGCMPCTGYISWKERLAKQNPRLYRKIQNELGQSLIDQYIEDDSEVYL